MDDERRRQIEKVLGWFEPPDAPDLGEMAEAIHGGADAKQVLLHFRPDLSRNLPLVRQIAEAINRVAPPADQSGNEWQPSDATRSDGQVVDSDVNKKSTDGFFSNMEQWRQQNMVPPETMQETTEQSPGQQWLRSIGLGDREKRDDDAAREVPEREYEDRSANNELNGKEPLDSDWPVSSQAGPGFAQPGAATIRRMPAAGRFGFGRAKR